MEKCLNGKYLVLNIVDQLHAGPCAIIILWYIKLRGLLIIIIHSDDHVAIITNLIIEYDVVNSAGQHE